MAEPLGQTRYGSGLCREVVAGGGGGGGGVAHRRGACRKCIDLRAFVVRWAKCVSLSCTYLLFLNKKMAPRVISPNFLDLQRSLGR